MLQMCILMEGRAQHTDDCSQYKQPGIPQILEFSLFFRCNQNVAIQHEMRKKGENLMLQIKLI